MKLLHLGNVVIDLVLTVDDLPGRGGDVIASSTATTPGGGFNVMAAAVRLGLPVGYGGAHGTGPFGDLARTALAEAGIDVLQPISPGLDTGFVVTLVEDDGERTFITSRGAESTLTTADLDRVKPGPGELVYLSGYGLMHPSNRAALVPWLGRIPDDVQVYVDPGPLGHQVPRTTWPSYWLVRTGGAATSARRSTSPGWPLPMKRLAPSSNAPVARVSSYDLVRADASSPYGMPSPSSSPVSRSRRSTSTARATPTQAPSSPPSPPVSPPPPRPPEPTPPRPSP